MNETQLDVTTGAESETRVESILKAISVTLPIAIQLFGLFRRPKAATATVGVANKPLPVGAGSTATQNEAGR